MPIYEYECQDCGETFAMLRGIEADDAEVKCPKCDVQHPRRRISLPSSSGSGTGTCDPIGGG